MEAPSNTYRHVDHSRPPTTRKRQTESGSSVHEVERPPKRHGADNRDRTLPLSEKNLALLDNMGKQSRALSTSSDSSTTTLLSMTAPGFAMRASKNGILDPCDSAAPSNLDEIREWHGRSRGSNSPTESEFKLYVRHVDGAQNEQSLLVQTAPRLLKDAKNTFYTPVFDQVWTGYDRAASFAQKLAAPHPDFAEGLEFTEFLPFPAHEELAGAMVRSDDRRSLVLPHIAGEWERDGGGMDAAQRQAAYNAAAMVCGRNEALALMGQPDPPGRSEVTTFATDGKQLCFYAHFSTESECGAVKYHQYRFASEDVKDTYEGHRKGRRALRNHQQRAMEKSYAMKEKLKEWWTNKQRDMQEKLKEYEENKQRDMRLQTAGADDDGGSSAGTLDVDEGDGSDEHYEGANTDTRIVTNYGFWQDR